MAAAILGLVVLLAGSGASAQVYRVVDENGNVTFTDKPPPNAEKLDIRTPNSSAPPTNGVFPKSSPSTTTDGEEGEEGTNYTLKITSPSDETIIPRGPGNFSVSASVSPSLQSGHKLLLMLDGSAHGEAQQSGSWSLTNVSRGEHALSVAAVDGSNKTLGTSASIKVYVFRPSINDVTRTNPVRPR